MTTPIEKLTKILDLEAEKHQDRAVFGGLARFADTWLREAGNAFGPEAVGWVRAVAGRLRAYSSLSDPQERAAALRELQQMLEKGPQA
ncbi:MAG TPA: hypothetical protein EYH30_06170, partial [Anaerolineales bacterium]|nr:hypothetical protein [Anaerolineales bacterium]